jgi:hypothetical protein
MNYTYFFLAFFINEISTVENYTYPRHIEKGDSSKTFPIAEFNLTLLQHISAAKNLSKNWSPISELDDNLCEEDKKEVKLEHDRLDMYYESLCFHLFTKKDATYGTYNFNRLKPKHIEQIANEEYYIQKTTKDWYSIYLTKYMSDVIKIHKIDALNALKH